MEFNDEEALKKENITIDGSTKEFDNNFQKLSNLKQSIEKEMTEIDKTYEKVDKETTKSYELKREKLKKEEEDLKEKLKNEVTKIKEKLELYLSEVNNLTKFCEKIKKGIASLEKDEKNMIKTLSYISKVNKNQKEMKILFQELMKSLIISFIEEESKIKYEEYYFNGIPTPKDIEFKEIGTNSFKVFWNIDDINLLNIDKKEINYNIEIRKENTNDNFVKINAGKNNNCLINNLEKNTNYEIRICSIYKDIISNWTKLFKIQTSDIDSVILNESDKGNEYLNKLYEWSGYKRMELIYRATRDGSGYNIFHNKCDNQGPTICLLKNDKGNIFGGYTSCSWTTDNNWHSANDSFLFTMTNIHKTDPTKFPNINSSYSVYHYSNHGPRFGEGADLLIYHDFLNNNNSYSNIGSSYQDTLGKGRSIFTGDIDNNNSKIKIKELEVFKLF